MPRPNIEEFLKQTNDIKFGVWEYSAASAADIARYALLMEKALKILSSKIECPYNRCPCNESKSCDDCTIEWAISQIESK